MKDPKIALLVHDAEVAFRAMADADKKLTLAVRAAFPLGARIKLHKKGTTDSRVHAYYTVTGHGDGATDIKVRNERSGGNHVVVFGQDDIERIP